MDKSFTILDERLRWFGPAIEAAKRRHYRTQRIRRGDEAEASNGLGFIRPHANPVTLKRNQTQDWPAMRNALAMVQDAAQVEVYENKSEQFRRWGHLMPCTWRFTDLDAAVNFIESETCPHVLVGKSDVGASSRNVYILRGSAEQHAYVLNVFTRGLEVDHCSGGEGGQAKSKQTGYVLLQRFIPHDFTYRVNIIGRHLAVFKRFNYPDRPVAQTGNVQPVMSTEDGIGDLLDYAAGIFKSLETKWCAIDVLHDPVRDDWVILETSLAWPWPSPGACMDAPFFGATTRRWGEIWDLMLDEYEAGVWSK